MKPCVIVPAYNNLPYLREALDSLVEQTLEPSKIIVSDDASTDETPAVIQEYADDYPDLVQPLLHDENVGIAGNYNRAFKEVDTELVTWLPGDDRYHPEKIEREVAKYEANPDAEVVFSNFSYTKPDGTRYRIWGDDVVPPTGDVLVECLTRDWPDSNLFRCPLVSMSALERVGFFDESLDVFLDWDMKIALAKHFRMAYYPEVLQMYRDHPGGHSKTVDVSQYIGDVERIRRKHADTIRELEPSDRRQVESFFDKKLLRFECRQRLQNGDRFGAQRAYLRLLVNHPEELTAVKIHAKYFLPTTFYRPLQRVYRRHKYGG